ncbi:GNAT family N-acetyltransferase [Pararhizobium haloflavum]|uniref:GNAT family N-acetyltransferase n=1 Tax=Pararhizobium haloflavum TaxID=2037914 RepID=UPI0013000E68|nr:GNAT family N-acetyltransferase [Pararhizobium haloflavum]
MKEHMQNAMIVTPRLVLRAPAMDDAGAIAAALGEFEVARMLARVPQPYDLTDARQWLTSIAEQQSAPFERHFAVTLEGRLVGMIGLEKRSDRPEIGYWLEKSCWGRGVMSEAVGAAVTWFFDTTPFDTLFAGVFADNPASFKLQEKLGFQVTGRSDVFSVGRNAMVAHIETALTREAFRQAVPQAA